MKNGINKGELMIPDNVPYHIPDNNEPYNQCLLCGSRMEQEWCPYCQDTTPHQEIDPKSTQDPCIDRD